LTALAVHSLKHNIMIFLYF